MSAPKVWVDWSDETHPVIRHEDDAPDGVEAKSLPVARREIIEHFGAQIKHAQAIIRRTRAVQAVPAPGGVLR